MTEKRERHRWSEKAVFPHKSERACLRGCGIVKVTRHEPDARPPHWVEYWRGLDKIDCVGAPVCEPVEVDA
jgi:hypothetical protein